MNSTGPVPIMPAAGGERDDAALHSEPVVELFVSPSRHVPFRTCVGCRVRTSADGLLRVVAASGVLVPDPRRRLPGRGAWLHPVTECLDRAERRSAIPRALRVPGPLDTAAVRHHVSAVSGVRDVPGSIGEESKVDPS